MTTAGQSWFASARFGMFIHWSHVAQQGWEMSWPLVGGFGDLLATPEIPVDDYYARALEFAPTPGAAKEWAAAARAAGMQYAVLTTKHHDGFALFPSDHSDFTIREAAYEGDDVVAEFVAACRDEGLRVGFYFSLSDWHHPDYPAFAEDDRPYLRYLGRRSDPEAWARYRAAMVGQIEELLTRYGTIDLLWFDGQWERTSEEWGTDDLARRIRALQPDIVINDRLPGQGDYATPEQGVPAQVPEGWWETCLTMNRSWGWVPDDDRYAPARDLLHTLLDIAGRGGNLLLNVSPRGDGSLPPAQVDRLQALARWMGDHGPAVVGTEPGLEPWQFYGPSTRRGDTVYLHLVMRPYERVTVRGMPIRRIGGVRLHPSGEELRWRTRAPVADQLGGGDPIGELTIDVAPEGLDEMATVIAVDVVPAG